MKRILKYLLLTAGSLIGFVLLIIVIGLIWASVSGTVCQKKYGTCRSGGKNPGYRWSDIPDLNKNGSLDKYEDIRCTPDERVNDLLSQMNLEEKAGLMFFPPVSMKKDGSISEKPSLNDVFSLMTGGTSKMIFGKQINHFNIFTGTDKKGMAVWYNNLQKLAERTRLGIPGHNSF